MANPLIVLGRPHFGIPPAPKNHIPDRSGSLRRIASHRLLMVKGGDSVRCSRRQNMDVDPERRKSGVSHLSFSLTLSTSEQHVVQCRSIWRLGHLSLLKSQIPIALHRKRVREVMGGSRSIGGKTKTADRLA